MDNFSLRQDFIRRTLATLENLVAEARRQNDTEAFRRAAFRALHTIKGTAQAIGFPASGKLAHELENLLAADEDKKTQPNSGAPNEARRNLFVEGLSYLMKTFEQTDFEIPAEFLERARAHFARQKSIENDEVNERRALSNEIPDEIFSQLMQREKDAARSAMRNEKAIFCLEADFDAANFADEFAAFRRALHDDCEVIAMLSPTTVCAPDRIGFRILLATAEDIRETIAANDAEIIFQSASKDFPDDLTGVFRRVAAHGEALAKSFGKQIEFIIAAEGSEKFPTEFLKITFDVLTHLVRNAVDHAIESPAERRALNKSARARVQIEFAEKDDGFYLKVADDGRGIDCETIKAAAREKKLLSTNVGSSDEDALYLIFLSGFSTRATVTEISGRGVGLDAARTAVETVGGRIRIRSESGKQTVFEIFLPQ